MRARGRRGRKGAREGKEGRWEGKEGKEGKEGREGNGRMESAGWAEGGDDLGTEELPTPPHPTPRRARRRAPRTQPHQRLTPRALGGGRGHEEEAGGVRAGRSEEDGRLRQFVWVCGLGWDNVGRGGAMGL